MRSPHHIRTKTIPDFAVLNGTLWTGDTERPWAEAFAAFQGRIVATGSTEEIRHICGKETGLFDAEHRLVVPGFIDGHVHFVTGGFSLLTANFTNARSRGDFVKIIRQQNNTLPPDAWMTGVGWDETKWETGALPDRTWIDSIVPDRPVYIIRQDLHMALVNSLALKLAGITESTPDPGGGTIDRDPDTMLPTGIIRDAAMALVEKVIPEPDEKSFQHAIQAACRECRKYGVTGVHDITLMSHIPHLNRAFLNDWFTVRVFARPPLRQWEAVHVISQGLQADPGLFKIGGLKAFIDGSLGTGTALFFEPYSDNPTQFGKLHSDMIPEGTLPGVAQAADRAGYNLSIHAIGDRANRILLDIFEHIRTENGNRDRRWRTEHAQHIHPDDFPRFHRLNVIASMQPYHCIDDARWCENRIGKERCRNSYAFKSFSDHTVRMVFGSDWTVAPLNPLTGIDAAVNRIPLGSTAPWYPEQRIPVEEALKGYTVNPTYAAFEEEYKGTLSPGKIADCAVLSDNIFTIPPETIKNVSVVATIFNGKIVYRKAT